MSLPAVIRAHVKDLAPPEIFRRGVAYYAQRSVGALHIEQAPGSSTVRIQAPVEGTDLYEASFVFDLETEKITEALCSCPYKGFCKHIVAVILAYASSLEKSFAKHSLPSSDEDHVRNALSELGLPTETIPQTLITELLSYKKKPTLSTIVKIESGFDPEDYFILLTTSQGYTPTLYRKDEPSQQTAINPLLARTDLTKAQRELFTYLKQGWIRDGLLSPDLAKLFPLLVASKIPAYKNYYAPHQPRRALTIELQPERLQAEILYTPAFLDEDRLLIRHDFVFRMPKIYWPIRDASQSDKAFSIQGSCVLQETKDAIDLHVLTHDLAGLISRLKPHHGETATDRARITSYDVLFTEEETTRLTEIVRDAKRCLELLSPPPTFQTEASERCEPTLLVDYQPEESFLEITPVIDYGIFKQPISESIYESRRTSGDILIHRNTTLPSRSYIFILSGNTLHYAKINEEVEKDFYRLLRQEAASLGFSKTLKCIQRGSSAVNDYLKSHWSELAEYARAEMVPVLFLHEKLAFEETTFRADFTTKLNADRDWLYFDLACYCGDEQVTLEKLVSYLASGDPFYRRPDGTLVTIANREALERLAELLKNFQAQEDGGFAGHLYSAPELEYVMTCSPYYNAIRAKSFQSFMTEVQQGRPVKPVHLPKRFADILRPYQKDGVDWLHFLRSYRFAGILADDMGLGKTIQTLVLLAMQRAPGKPSLVVCPKTLVYNWKLEAEKYTPELKVLVIEGSQRERRRWYLHDTEYDLIILSYTTLKQDAEYLTHVDRSFNYVVLDEAQYIKNHATKSAQVVKKLKADYRLALTGTPFENSVSEIWSIFDFLMPGFLGTHDQFFKRFQKPIMEESNQAALKHLRQKVQSFMLRRTKSEVLKELPAKIEQVSVCHLSDSQTILYQEILAKVRGDVFETIKREGFKRSQMHILAALTKLRQVCNHPALLTKNKDWRAYESTKLDTCLELIQEVVQGNHKVLVFSQFTSMLDIVSEALKDQNISHKYLSGKTKDRQKMVDAFNQDPAIPVFLISLKAGGTGLNLTAADTVIIFDPWWNPSVENQATDRAHRIGQTQTVNVYRLLTLGTIEEKIQALKQKKQTLFNAMVGESKDLFKKISWEDIKELFA